jgi:uncharacterized damage-inducible protein DinB
MQDIAELLAGLKGAVPILAAFVRGLPADKLTLRRGPGAWTVAEHVAHLAQVQPLMLERLERFRDEDRPEFVPYIPGEDDVEDTPPQMPIDEALTAFDRYRNRQLALLDTADDIFWHKTANHPEYALYSAYILVRHILLHDYWHMFRMEELWLTRDAYLSRLE